MSNFDNAKACFAENVNKFLPGPSRQMEKNDALMWNLNKGLHSLTVAIEQRFGEMEYRIQCLEQVLKHGK
jgi:hypothetical protein